MRIGKPLEHAQAAVKALDVSDPVLKFTALGRQLGYAGYLFNDMLVWVTLSFPLPSLFPASSLTHPPLSCNRLTQPKFDLWLSLNSQRFNEEPRNSGSLGSCSL